MRTRAPDLCEQGLERLPAIAPPNGADRENAAGRRELDGRPVLKVHLVGNRLRDPHAQAVPPFLNSRSHRIPPPGVDTLSIRSKIWACNVAAPSQVVGTFRPF